MAETEVLDQPVLHVIVIGFHHKKGCQVEYAYPPLIPGKPADSHEVPPEWKHLPSLAIPDGAHNFTEDTVFFHLPARGEKLETVYGVSCYRQIDATELRNRGAEVTRNSVQKSVCVLSRLPLYGLIQAKLELITHAYFDERDFTQVSLLEDTYKNLCASLRQSLLDTSQVFLGLSSRDMVQSFKHKLLILFKLMLLERRVLFSGSPVRPICTTMLSVLSLFPRLIEYGLQESASYSPTRQLSPTLKVTRLNSGTDDANEFLEVHYTETPSSTNIKHAEKVEKTPTKVDIKVKRASSSSSSEGSGSLSSSWREGGLRKHRSRVSPGHPVQVTEVEGQDEPMTSRGSDNLPGIHRQNSRDSQGSSSNEQGIDHPLSMRNRHCSAPAEVPAGRDRLNSGSKRDKDRDNRERKLEKTDGAAEGEGARGTTPPIGDTPPPTPPASESLFDSLLNQKSKKDPLEFVQEITKVSSVQKHLQRLSSSGRSSSLPDEQLTADEQELLADPDECAFSWQEDKLLLEINEDLESPPDVFGSEKQRHRTASGKGGENGATRDVGESEVVEQEDGSSEGVTRSHNLDLEADLFGSLGGSRSNATTDELWEKGGGKAGGKSSLRNKLSGVFSGSKENHTVELTELKPETPSSLNVDEFGFPISIFTKGMLCHPYLSLQFYDLLQDVNVRGFAIGATNVLYKQKRHLLDAIVDVTGEGKIEIHDAELRKQVNLTTADLRFGDYLVKATQTLGTLYLDDTSWEGGEEWLRSQFRHYLLSLLAVSQTNDEKMQEDFNLSFLAAWKTTHNYKLWNSTRHSGMADVSCAHPYHGQVTMSDMKLKLEHSLSNTERGKKVNAAMASTGKVVLQTGKVVGGALTSAKSVVSSWFSSWRQPSTDKTPDSPTDDPFTDLTNDTLDTTEDNAEVESRSDEAGSRSDEVKQDQTEGGEDSAKEETADVQNGVEANNVAKTNSEGAGLKGSNGDDLAKEGSNVHDAMSSVDVSSVDNVESHGEEITRS